MAETLDGGRRPYSSPVPARADVLDRPAPGPDAVLRYAEHRDAVVDVHLPAEPPGEIRPAPVLVLLHGGFWRDAWDRRHTRPLAAALRDRGWLVATPEYRRTGGLGGWPGTLDDIAELREGVLPLLSDVLAGRVAAAPPTLVGHSAGGHLALWWALTSESFPPRRTVGLAPVGDLARADEERLGSGAVAALLGGALSELPERYAAADPAARMRAGEVPAGEVVLVHGRHDEDVPVEHSRDLATDVGVALLELDCEHFALIDPLSTVWPSVRDAVGALPGSHPSR
jgi:acetyl esterase/lipase